MAAVAGFYLSRAGGCLCSGGTRGRAGGVQGVQTLLLLLLLSSLNTPVP